MECFRILGINVTTDTAIIKKAYKQQVKKHHPDVGGDPKIFIKIREALEEALKYTPTSRAEVKGYLKVGKVTLDSSGYKLHFTTLNVEHIIINKGVYSNVGSGNCSITLTKKEVADEDYKLHISYRCNGISRSTTVKIKKPEKKGVIERIINFISK